MKLTDLKSPYRELAEMRREKTPHPTLDIEFSKSNLLEDAFDWIKSPEEIVFWDAVDGGEFPDIPQSSHFELAAWKLQKRVDNLEPELKDVLKSQLKDPTALIESPDHRLFTAAVAAMQGYMIRSEGLTLYWAEGIMGTKQPTEKSEQLKWWEEAEAKYCVRKAQALIEQLNKAGK